MLRRLRFRTLASQITVLAAVPTAAVLLAVAGLILFLNQHTRLEALLRGDAALAEALAGSVVQVLRETAEGLVQSGGPMSGQENLFVNTGRIRPGEPAFGETVFGPDLAPVARDLAAQVRAEDGFALSPILEGSAESGSAVLIAQAREDGSVLVGLVRVSPDISGLAWQLALRRRLPSSPGVQLALVDPRGVVAYHDDRERIAEGLALAETEGAVPTGALLHSAPDVGQRISAFAPLGSTGWSVMLERPWNSWLEAFRGLGLVALAPLVLAAVLPALLIALAASRATRPVRQLAAAAARIAAGDFRPFRVDARTGDELEALGQQFESMAGQLKSLYGSLEEQVADRTAELQMLVDVARAVSGSFQASEVMSLAEAELSKHPRLAAAHVWVSGAAAEAMGIRRAAPQWLDTAELEVVVAVTAGPSAAGCLRLRGPAARGTEPSVAYAVPMELREGRAALVAAPCGEALGPDLERLLLTVAAQVAIALDNAILYREGRVRAALEERNRLAREIHDTLAQTLTGVIVQLEAMGRAMQEPSGASAHLHRVLELARGGLQEARRSVHGLRASALDGRTLDEALTDAVARLQESAELRARFARHGDTSRIPAAVAVELYRIVQEALTNIVRHARASHVLVNLEVAETAARLVIEDDGAGIEAAPDLPPGFGLLGMRERAERLGGRLLLESGPGSGTRVEAMIPFDAQVEAAGESDR